MKKKSEEERDENKNKDTSTHYSEINYSKCQSYTHKSNECSNKRVLMLRGKGFYGDSKVVFFPNSSSRMERQDQIRPCVKKGSHSKSTWIQHKANTSLKRKCS